jgi:ubiquinol-cytochrome c reductase iron-sulfur subunit
MGSAVTDQNAQEPSRRDFIYIAAGGAAAVGGAMFLWPFIDQMNPAADTLALASIRFDTANVEDGQQVTVMWRGGPVFVRRRTETEVAEATSVDVSVLPDPDARNDNLPSGSPATEENRAAGNGSLLIVKGNCTHLGCVPLGEAGEYDGWYCPCHGSHYDTAGRIRRGPAPENLGVPPLSWTSETVVQIG